MNCKPGDIAIVVGRRLPTGDRMPESLIGRICKVEKISIQSPPHIPVWVLESQLLITAKNDLLPHDVYAKSMPDACLRPIRDPGDDAVDEMVQMFTAKIPEGVPA